MAACRDAEDNTTFPFLATVRTLVAIVVSALAFAVLVMVIIFVHRPVEMGFQSYGYVQTQELWCHYDNATSHWPAREVDMLFVVEALNPSGRGQIEVNINMIRILDSPDPSFADVVQFCWYKPETNVSFDLLPQSSHRFRRWVKLNQSQTSALNYLYRRRCQDFQGFTVMVVVETTYKPAPQHSEKTIDKTYYCWPVTFLLSDANTPDAGEVACKTKEDLEYTVSWTTL